MKQPRLRQCRCHAIIALALAGCLGLGSSSAGERPVPAGAAALGYTRCVIDERPTAADIAPDHAKGGNYKWFNGALWGTPPPMSLYSTADGALALRYDAETKKQPILIGTPEAATKTKQ